MMFFQLSNRFSPVTMSIFYFSLISLFTVTNGKSSKISPSCFYLPLFSNDLTGTVD